MGLYIGIIPIAGFGGDQKPEPETNYIITEDGDNLASECLDVFITE